MRRLVLCLHTGWAAISRRRCSVEARAIIECPAHRQLQIPRRTLDKTGCLALTRGLQHAHRRSTGDWPAASLLYMGSHPLRVRADQTDRKLDQMRRGAHAADGLMDKTDPNDKSVSAEDRRHEPNCGARLLSTERHRHEVGGGRLQEMSCAQMALIHIRH
jgi:hypothetical protein